jgi:DNA-binding response OmpR family regulator
MNVLIIEDSLTTAMTLETFVTACGHLPVCVPNSWLAWPVVDVWPIDLVLLDILLPGMDGYEVARRLREKGVRALIIAVTSLEDDLAKRLEYGIDGHLGKPVSMTQLKDVLEQYEARLVSSSGAPAQLAKSSDKVDE